VRHVFASRIFLIHTAHEGSHAIGKELMEKAGVFFTGEGLDARYYEGDKHGPASRRRTVVAWVCNGGGEAGYRVKRKITDEGLGWFFKEPGVPRDPNTTALTLVRTDFNQDIRRCATVRGRVDVVLLVRRDLLRWSLSRYTAPGWKEPDHPQFSNNYVAPAKRYEPEHLRQVARQLVEDWRAVLLTIKELHHCCTRQVTDIRIVTYESFLADQKATIDYIMADLPRNVHPDRPRFHHPRKIHDHAIGTFVLNVAEIERAFASWGLPTFQDVYDEELAGFPKPPIF